MNEVFQTKTHLHFGATVSISCFNTSKFYMFTNGISFKTVISIAQTQGPFNPAMCLFVVTPVMKFQSQSFLQRLLNNRYNDDTETVVQDEKKTKVFIDQFEFELQQNNKLKDQQLNSPIKYNENFMLQHVYSSKYLSYSKNVENNEYTLELSQIPTTCCIFSLKACFNYQKDINTYVPFNSAAFLNVKIQQKLQVREMNLNFVANSAFDSWLFSEESQDKIKLELYKTSEQVEYKNICFGDAVWIFHLESGSFVKVIIDEQRKSNSIILNKIKYTLGYTNETKTMNQMQEIEESSAKLIVQKSQNEMSAQKFGLWIILPVVTKDSNNQAIDKGKFMGGKVKFDQQIRFFNPKYKTYLGVRKNKKGRNQFKFQYDMEDHEEQSTIFVIKSLSSSSAFVTTEDLFLIYNVFTSTFLTLPQPFSINQTRAALEPAITHKKQDNFKFTKIDFLQEWQNNNILSIMPFIIEGIRALKEIKNQAVSHRDEVILRLMCENLVEILSFSYDLTEGFEASESKLGKMTYNHFSVQKLLREQQVINRLIEVLDAVNPDHFIENITGRKSMPIKMMGIINIVKKYGVGAKEGHSNNFIKIQVGLLERIINTTLKILRNCCKSNTENSLILFKKAKSVIKFLSLGTYAQNFIMDSFNNNIILSRISAEDIKLIIDQYIKVYTITKIPSQRLFELLTKLIKIGDQSIGKNQLQIYRLFFYKDNPLLVPVQQRDNSFFIENIELNQFCDEYPDMANILGEQIKFCAELTSDRNYVCSSTIKKLFPLSIVFNYLITNPVKNEKVKQSFLWLIIHSYLNERPRFKKTTPFVFQIPYEEQKQIKSSNEEFEIEMQIMAKQGLSQQIINDIMSCVQQGDEMTENDLANLKVYVLDEIKQILEDNSTVNFYTSKMQVLSVCLKYLIQLAVFKEKQIQQIERVIEKIAKKVDESLVVKNDATEKMQSTNFRELLLQMVQKNVIKKFNYSAKYDGIEDEVKFDNICSIFVNYSFYQNILLAEKDSKKRKQADSVITIVLQLISIYGEMKKVHKIKKIVEQLSKPQNLRLKSRQKSPLIKQIIIDNILESSEDVEDIFNLLVLLFYNSNTYSINNISINHLLGEIFSDRIAIESLTTIQINVCERQKSDYAQMLKITQNIRLLIETSQIWFNVPQLTEKKVSKYEPVILLFINKIKQIIKIVIPQFDEGSNEPLFGCKYAKSIIPEKQQILSNLGLHQQILQFLQQYRMLILKIKGKNSGNHNGLLVHLFKCCFLFLFVFIYDSPENKNEVHEVVREFYLRDYFKEVGNLDLGETIFIIEYLKNNYEQCIQFYGKNPQMFQKTNQFTTTHSKLLLTMMSFYNEPILVNIRKFYISIFDFTSFKSFLWFKPNNDKQLNLELSLYQSEVDKQPILYHIHAIEAVLKVITYIDESRNTIRQHIRKSLSQQYLYKLLELDDYYTQENSNNPILQAMVYFKCKIMKIIEFAYFVEDIKNDNLILGEFKRQNGMLSKLITQSPARQENEDFRKVMLIRDIKQQSKQSNSRIRDLLEAILIKNNEEHILQAYLNSIDQFVFSYKRHFSKSQNKFIQQMIGACDEIHNKITKIYDILHKSLKNFAEGERNEINKYPVPFEWLLKMSTVYPDQQSFFFKKYISSFLIESIFNQSIYLKFVQNQKRAIKQFLKTLNSIQLKPFFFLRKTSEFIEDAFEKLSNNPTPEMYKELRLLIYFLTLWLQCQTKQKANELRSLIGKSELIFPILNFFETCIFDKLNKEIFLICLEFFNELIGEDGNRTIQTIFNQYFTTKADSIQFFMKIKQLFDAINFEDRANYKCKKIYDSIEQLSKDSKLQKQSQFIILNFLIRLCKGNFRDNQIFLSSLSNVSNFNIMSGIWQILKYQSQKYKKNLINVENYHLITQCFSTIRELVEGPCVQNQNEFLKRDFFLTVLDYFQFEATETDLTLQNVLEQRLKEIEKISASFSDKLRIYLNRDKITNPWMPSQVKYRCISLICSLLSQNVNEQSKSQLYTINPAIIIKQLDQVYHRYKELNLTYTYQNLQVKEQTEVVLPLGFKLFELLQYYPVEKLPLHSPGLDFFRLNSRTVEILHQKLCIVVFPHIPDEISDAYKQKFLQEVDRSSVNSKLRGLQDAQVQNKQSDYPYGYLLLFFVLVITVLDILLYNSDSLTNVEFFNFYPYIRMYGIHEVYQTMLSVLIMLTLFLSIIFLILEAKGAIYFREQTKKLINSNLPTTTKVFQIIRFVWNNLTYFHYFVTLVLCILTVFNPFFDAILLMVQLYRRSETFSAIVDAISSTLDQLVVVLLFTFICTYVCTAFFYFYRAENDYPDQCQNLYHCFAYSLDIGFRSDSGMAGATDDEETILQDYLQETLQDVLINFLYLFLIKVIIEQIIGAIMVDKFAELRQNKQRLKEDEDSNCFICGLGRNLLDRQQNGFEYHKIKYHHVWNYFEFLIYIRKSKLSNLSGIELFVYEQQKTGKLNWFPISRSYHMQLKNQEANEKQLEENQVDKMSKMLDTEFHELKDEITVIWNLLNAKLAKEQTHKE